jgi:hypothetical protein
MITPSFSITATERVLPKLALDFTTASLDSRVTFTRTTDATNPATYVNSSGYVTAATNNQPRFDYDPVTLACKGLLIEESRTNLYTYSSDFRDTATAGSTRPWVYLNSSVVEDDTTAPDNTDTGDLLLPTAGLGSHRLNRSVTMTGNVTYTQTLYAKPAGYSRIALYWVGLGYYTTFDVSTGQVLHTLGGISSTISSAGNGWYKITNTYTQAASPGSGIRIYVVSPSAVTIADFDANGTDGVYIWGAQMEAGAFATSYIPTTTTALTRNADVATMTGTNFSDWYNQTQGSFYASSDSLYISASPVVYGRPLTVRDGTASNVLELLYTPTVTALQGYVAGSFQGGPGVGGTILANTIYEQVGAYATNNVNSGVNGVAGTTDTTFAIPTVNEMRIGAGRGNTPPYHNGHIQKIMYWPQRLTNAEIAAFSK